MARPGLKSELRTAINKVRKSNKEEVRPGVQVKVNGGYETITLKVKPVAQAGVDAQLIMVLFEEAFRSEESPTKIKPEKEEDHAHIRELEHELASTREYLRTTIEELEISNEELKSSNEELQSANEELQSTNEELETSKEELQSVNEEMITVNSELQNKIFELGHAHDDMANLLASTEIGTVFLGKNLEIRRFTPSITKVINLIQTDIGRPVSHLSSNLLYENLADEAQTVLDSLEAKRMAVQSKEGSWYHMQITPYRTTDNVIDGIVMTFVDISEEKRMEEELAKVNQHLNLALEALHAVPFIYKLAGNDSLDFIFVGESSNRMFGFMPVQLTSDPGFWIKRIHRSDKKKFLEEMSKVAKSDFGEFDFRWKCANGKYKNIRIHVRLVRSVTDKKEDAYVGIWRDIGGREENNGEKN
jgi:two-component system CheB/CheR fusion protein